MSDFSGKLSQIRQDYQQHTLDEQDVGDDPVLFFQHWMQQALDAQVMEPTAMTVATVDAAGIPHARIVLLKGVASGKFIFFTNLLSDKGVQIQSNPHVALIFFWKEIERQVRIEGMASQVSDTYADEYFYSRPVGSQIGAIASPQSAVIPDRQFLENKVKLVTETNKIQRPVHWSGYAIEPSSIEFWQGRSNRLHDRIRCRKINNTWIKERLAP